MSVRADTTPRVRGLRDRRQSAIWISRYNPACAGTTFASLTVRTEISIQPRVCGDYDVIHGRILQAHDTTPRVRGLHCSILLPCICHRYNPACAGTTPKSALEASLSSIQPRVCGDYQPSVPLSIVTPDTTPRVRGLLCAQSSVANAVRYNPACAGTTDHDCGRASEIWIQPRVCGDYELHFFDDRRYRDTTPRVRGLLIV